MSELDIHAALSAHVAAQTAVREYKLPNSEIVVGVRVLSDAEIDHARIEAQRYCGKHRIDLQIDPDFLEREVTRQIVWRSVFHPTQKDNGQPVRLWPSDVDVRNLPSTMVEGVFALYLEHQDRMAPMRSISEEQIATMRKAVRKGEKRVTAELSALDHRSLVALAVGLLRASDEAA